MGKKKKKKIKELEAAFCPALADGVSVVLHTVNWQLTIIVPLKVKWL